MNKLISKALQDEGNISETDFDIENTTDEIEISKHSYRSTRKDKTSKDNSSDMSMLSDDDKFLQQIIDNI